MSNQVFLDIFLICFYFYFFLNKKTTMNAQQQSQVTTSVADETLHELRELLVDFSADLDKMSSDLDSWTQILLEAKTRLQRKQSKRTLKKRKFFRDEYQGLYLNIK